MTFVSKLKAWLTTSSSIIGTSGLGAALTAAAAGKHWTAWAPMAVAGVIAIIMPQNVALSADAQALVAAGVKVARDLDPSLAAAPNAVANNNSKG